MGDRMAQEMPKSQANIARAVKQKLESLRDAGDFAYSQGQGGQGPAGGRD